MAPFDRRPERPLTFGRVARAVREERQSAIETLEKRFRAEELRARRGELDRQRQAVQAATDRLDRRARREAPSRPRGLVRGTASPHLRRQRLERVLTLPGNPQRRSARHDHAQPIGGGEKRCEVRRGREQVLEVVEQEQQLLPAQIAEKVVACRERPSDLRARRARDPSGRRAGPRTLRPQTCRPAPPRPAARGGSCPSRQGR